MDNIMNFLYWWNENIYLLKIIESFDNGLYSIILVMFILFLYPIPWAIVLTWIGQLKISIALRFWSIILLTIFVVVGDFLLFIAFTPFMIMHLVLYRKEKITKRMLFVSIVIILLTQIKPITDNHLYYIRCGDDIYDVKLLDSTISLKDFESNFKSTDANKNYDDYILSVHTYRKKEIFGLSYHDIYLKKDDRLIAKETIPVSTNGWTTRMLGYMFGQKNGDGSFCYPDNHDKKLIAKLKELISENNNNNKTKQSI